MPCAPDPDMVGVLFGAEEVGVWALELENEWEEEGEGVGERGESLFLYKGSKIMCLPTCLKTRLFPKRRADGAVGLPMPVLMRIP